MLSFEELRKRLQTLTMVNGSYECRKWKTKEGQILRREIESAVLFEFKTLQEKIWALKNNVQTRPVCHQCGGKVKFKDSTFGFFKTCSQKCSSLSKERKDKIRKTSIERYGTEHPTQSTSYKNKMKERDILVGFRPGGFGTKENSKALLEKYGVNNVFQSEEIKLKIKETHNKRYGVDNPQQNKEIRKKTKRTNNQRYGVDYPFQSVSIQNKIKETLMLKYGVDNPLKSDVIQNKIKMTCLERYGVEHPLHDPNIFEKCQRSQSQKRYKYKEKILPSGKKIYHQGYEGYVIDYLLLAGIEEKDIETERYIIPTIDYNFYGKERKYFPDIFIRSKNLLIEVKSTYTYSKEPDKNLAKHWAAKEQGYNHIIIIWDEKNSCVFEIVQ